MNVDISQPLLRVYQWIISNLHRSLPSTPNKLCNAIRSMSYVEFHISPDEMISTLEKLGILQIDNFGTVTYTPNHILLTNTNNDIAQEGPDAYIFTRVLNWLGQQQRPPKSREALGNSLLQICLVKLPVNPEDVVKKLFDLRCILIDASQSLQYTPSSNETVTIKRKMEEEGEETEETQCPSKMQKIESVTETQMS